MDGNDVKKVKDDRDEGRIFFLPLGGRCRLPQLLYK